MTSRSQRHGPSSSEAGGVGRTRTSMSTVTAGGRWLIPRAMSSVLSSSAERARVHSALRPSRLRPRRTEPRWVPRYLLRSHGASTYEPDDRDEHDRTNCGDDDRADQTARLGTRQDQREEPAAHQGPDEAEDEVPDQAVAASLHDHASEPPGDKSHDDPSDESHTFPPSPFG